MIGTALVNGGHIGLLDVLFEQPYCRTTNVMNACNVSRPTATGWLKALVDAGVLTSFKAGRERIFVNTRFMDLLVTEAQESEEKTLF